MNIISIFCVSSILFSMTNPASNFCAPINDDTAAEIRQAIVDNQYDEKLDYNGDGKLTLKDVFFCKKKISSQFGKWQSDYY